MKTAYALIWKQTVSDEKFGQALPAIMDWLRGLKRAGRLLACGGGGAAEWNGGLTVIEAASPEEALAEAARSPQAAIGTTEVFEWGVWFARLDVPREF